MPRPQDDPVATGIRRTATRTCALVRADESGTFGRMRRVAALLALVVVVAARPGAATVYAPMDDATLADASAAIVTGTVVASGARAIDGRIVTETTVAVDNVYKGATGPTVTVTTPGGEVGDTRAVVFGTPSFVDGEAVLLYLQQAASGEVRTTGLALGAYRLETAADGTVTATHSVPFLETRRLDDVAATTQALGDPGSPVASTGEADGASAIPRFTFLGSPPGRWFQVDQGQPVRLSVANADAALGAPTSNAVVDAALGAWTAVPSARIVLQRGGATAPARSVAGGTCDGVSTIQFNDPFGEIPPMHACFGVLAIGGFCTKGNPSPFAGQQFAHISEADLTVADGLGTCIAQTSYEEVLTHETGHAIGMGHSSENPNEPPTSPLYQATMYFLVHFDGRGASLRSDDIAGISALYPDTIDPNDVDGDGVPNDADACPATPTGVAVDTNGCGCAEAGHVPCDDGLTCTQDGCNPQSGRCDAIPRDCTQGDPCLTGSCDEATGCSTSPVTGNAAVLCVYQRPFPPTPCAGERVPGSVHRHLRRAARLAEAGLFNNRPRLLGTAARELKRARAAIDRAARRRRNAAEPVCAAALGALLDDARSRLPLPD
jgi:hypothetical protein